MNYEKIYSNLIIKAKIRKLDEYYELHHIIPTSQGGKNIESNLCKLTVREHCFAHKLIWKINRINYPNGIYSIECFYKDRNHHRKIFRERYKLPKWIRKEITKRNNVRLQEIRKRIKV